jgi:hypothetical protein
LGGREHRVLPVAESVQNLRSLLHFRLVSNAGNHELLREIVGEVVVRGGDDSTVIVMAFQQVIERIQFLRSCTSNLFSTLLRESGLDVHVDRMTCA